MTIALLAAIESLLCAVVADGMIDDRHNSNQELMAQGIANIVSPLFGGIAVTGAIESAHATNVKCGARSPIAGIIHALTLLMIILLAGRLAKFIPLATLSAILVMVSLNMGEWHNFARLPKWPRSDAAVFLANLQPVRHPRSDDRSRNGNGAGRHAVHQTRFRHDANHRRG